MTMKPSVEKWLKEQMPEEAPEILQEIYAEYQATALRLLDDLKTKFKAEEEFGVIDKIAHTLKGNALMVGDVELFEVVQAWRGDLKEGKRDLCLTALPAIEKLVRAL